MPFAVRIQHPENLSRQPWNASVKGHDIHPLLFDFDGVMCYFYVTVMGSGRPRFLIIDKGGEHGRHDSKG
ncbi:MAG: hypothetical protein HZA18_00580, partial [Nitrospirae bacterium]|nr:hypothetical protein [Nitrospirota bacterium]